MNEVGMKVTVGDLGINRNARQTLTVVECPVNMKLGVVKHVLSRAWN